MDQAAPINVEIAPAAGQKPGATAVLTGLGIVFGDLGTSPLYAYHALIGAVGGHPSANDAIGLLSLVVWALIITVSIKYCLLVMRADNHGEGGILALMALVTGGGRKTRGVWLLIAMGLFGAALIYGDGVITPAISVLSSLEGINVATDAFKPYVLPAALLILVALPAMRRRLSRRHLGARPRHAIPHRVIDLVLNRTVQSPFARHGCPLRLSVRRNGL